MKRSSILGVAGLVIVTFALTMISWTPVKSKPAVDPNPAIADTSSTLSTPRAPIVNVKDIYESAQLAQSGLSYDVFTKAVTGFYNLKTAGKISDNKSILTIADFDQSSTKKRMWIVDLDKGTLLLNTWVAHGTFSGADRATNFSNTRESLKSSIGFYVTGETYRGKHGLSLRLDGMDEGFNTNARKRAIVVHGADYVSQSAINSLGRLGRSQGCPAVPQELAGTVINTIKDKTVLFINASIPSYSSLYLEENEALIQDHN
jgi:hypothetical protein